MRTRIGMLFAVIGCSLAGGCTDPDVHIESQHTGSIVRLAFIASHSDADSPWFGGDSEVLRELYEHMINDLDDSPRDPMSTGTSLPVPEYSVLFALDNGQYVETHFDASLEFVCFISDESYPTHLKYNGELEKKVSDLVKSHARVQGAPDVP